MKQQISRLFKALLFFDPGESMRNSFLIPLLITVSMWYPIMANQTRKEKAKTQQTTSLVATPKEQVITIRKIATQTLENIEQRFSTEDISKLAPYRDDPETTKELIISILQDRIGSLRVNYAVELKSFGPETADLDFGLKSAIINRGIKRLNNWSPSWTSDQINKMVADRKETVTP